MLATNPVTANLIKARELIADPTKWTVGTRHDDEGRMCALGAVEMVLTGQKWGVPFGHWGTTPEVKLLSAATSTNYGYGANITYCNNHLGHDATMKMFDRAIELSLASPEMPADAPQEVPPASSDAPTEAAEARLDVSRSLETC